MRPYTLYLPNSNAHHLFLNIPTNCLHVRIGYKIETGGRLESIFLGWQAHLHTGSNLSVQPHTHATQHVH